MNTIYNTVVTVVALLLGAVVTHSFMNNLKTQLSVGDCVRELGHSAVETVTVITPKGAVETRYPNKYREGEFVLQAYDSVDASKLYRVECNTDAS